MTEQRCEQEVWGAALAGESRQRRCRRTARWKVTKPNGKVRLLCAQHKTMWMRMGLAGWEATPIGDDGE